MLLNELMKVDGDVFLIEADFDGLERNLRSLDYMGRLRCLPEGSVPAAINVSDRKGGTLGVAFKNRHPEGDFWFLVPYPLAPASRGQTERLAGEVLGSGVVRATKRRRADAGQFARAVREYLSVSLVERSLCDCAKEIEPLSFAVNSARDARISRLIATAARKHGLAPAEIDALEICCGNGMSTAPLRRAFRSVLSVDNDKCAVCNGLYHGTLAPDEAMVADATRLSEYGLPLFGAVLGFMLGTIYDFNRPAWRAIAAEAAGRLIGGGLLIVTVSGKEEMDFLQECFASKGIHGDVIDNRQKDSIYDSWALVAVKNDDR